MGECGDSWNAQMRLKDLDELVVVLQERREGS